MLLNISFSGHFVVLKLKIIGFHFSVDLEYLRY